MSYGSVGEKGRSPILRFVPFWTGSTSAYAVLQHALTLSSQLSNVFRSLFPQLLVPVNDINSNNGIKISFNHFLKEIRTEIISEWREITNLFYFLHCLFQFTLHTTLNILRHKIHFKFTSFFRNQKLYYTLENYFLRLDLRPSKLKQPHKTHG
jgi:hypothetical protein